MCFLADRDIPASLPQAARGVPDQARVDSKHPAISVDPRTTIPIGTQIWPPHRPVTLRHHSSLVYMPGALALKTRHSTTPNAGFRLQIQGFR